MGKAILLIAPLLIGYTLDLWLGDPDNWPHPVRVFGNMIAKGERILNKSRYRFIKGMLLAVLLTVSVFFFFSYLNVLLLSFSYWLFIVVNGIFVWYGLANKSLITEGKNVFLGLEHNGLEAGRRQLSRIVGRDTSQLTEQQIRIAVLETMSENLSDGVIAPLFYYAIAGIPGMMAYKMINTMDSMLGYRNERYEWFGKFPAQLDDVANFIPARLTALLMILVTGSNNGFRFILKYANNHKSPNAGYPESALAGILNCRFGGPNVYHGVVVEKPFIGEIDRVIKSDEIRLVSWINHGVCLVMVLLCVTTFVFNGMNSTNEIDAINARAGINGMNGCIGINGMNSVATRLVVPTELESANSSVETTNLVAIDFNLWNRNQNQIIHYQKSSIK